MELRRVRLFLSVLIAALAYQLKMVLPYTFLWKKQVKQVRQTSARSEQANFADVSNVLTPNTQYQLLIEQIQKHQPDLVLNA